MINRHKSDFPSEEAFYEAIGADLFRYIFWISIVAGIPLVAAILFDQLDSMWMIALVLMACAAYFTAPYRNRFEIRYVFDDLQQQLALHGVQVRRHSDGPTPGTIVNPTGGAARLVPADQPYGFQNLKADLERHGASIRKVDEE